MITNVTIGIYTTSNLIAFTNILLLNYQYTENNYLSANNVIICAQA